MSNQTCISGTPTGGSRATDDTHSPTQTHSAHYLRSRSAARPRRLGNLRPRRSGADNGQGRRGLTGSAISSVEVTRLQRCGLRLRKASSDAARRFGVDHAPTAGQFGSVAYPQSTKPSVGEICAEPSQPGSAAARGGSNRKCGTRFKLLRRPLARQHRSESTLSFSIASPSRSALGIALATSIRRGSGSPCPARPRTSLPTPRGRQQHR